MLNKDYDMMAVRKLKDPRSEIFLDGREVMKGADWKERIAELAERSGGKCEYWFEGYKNPSNRWRCVQEAADPHHVIPRRDGRDDRLANLQALCRPHHNEMDERQVRWTKESHEPAQK
jgi:HNH endonuclease